MQLFRLLQKAGAQWVAQTYIQNPPVRFHFFGFLVHSDMNLLILSSVGHLNVILRIEVCIHIRVGHEDVLLRRRARAIISSRLEQIRLRAFKLKRRWRRTTVELHLRRTLLV